MNKRHDAGEYFDTAPQTDEPLDSSWRVDGQACHDGPLVLKTGKRQITMTLDDLLDEEDIKDFVDDDERSARARQIVNDIISE